MSERVGENKSYNREKVKKTHAAAAAASASASASADSAAAASAAAGGSARMYVAMVKAVSRRRHFWIAWPIRWNASSATERSLSPLLRQ